MLQAAHVVNVQTYFIHFTDKVYFLISELRHYSILPSKTQHDLLVFAAFNTITSGYIADYVAMMEEQRNLDSGALNALKDTLTPYFSSQTAEQTAIWSSKQAYIGLGTALIAAAELKVDATPMEGFNPEVFDEVLGLSEKNLHASVILSLGYRDTDNDYLASMPKVRLPISEFSKKID